MFMQTAFISAVCTVRQKTEYLLFQFVIETSAFIGGGAV